MFIADTHIHLNDSQYASDWRELIAQAAEQGVRAFIVPGTDLPTSRRSLEMAQLSSAILPAIGIHPHEADSFQEGDIERLRQLAPQALALGEIGLDFHYNFSPPGRQLEVLEAQLELAHSLNLPLILHLREADGEAYPLLKRWGLPPAGGVVHCFSSDWEAARRYLDLGFYLGFTGMITFPKLEELRQVARRSPLDRLLIETDGPYLAPVPYRGRRCLPQWIRYTLTQLASVRQRAEEEILEITSQNAIRLFGPRLSHLLTEDSPAPLGS